MSSPVVSILVPCYNVSKYLEECLDSIVHQTYPHLEIICINDGSTDNTLEILKRYAERDDRISIIDKANSGYGASMNQGLDKATGDFVGIVEPDDFLELDMVAALLNEAIHKNLDISRGAYFCYTTATKSNKLSNEKFVELNKVLKPLDNPELFYQTPAIWSAIYKRSLIEENHIRFLETPGASYQDTSFAFKTRACCQRFSMVGIGLLHYRTDNDASSTNNVKKAFVICEEFNEIWRFAASNTSRYQALRYVIPYLQFNSYAWVFNRLADDLKIGFAQKWSETVKAQIAARNIRWRSFSVRRQILLFLIAHFPKRIARLSHI